MNMRVKISKEKLDAFGPYGAAIGAALANILLFLSLLCVNARIFFNIYPVTLLIFPYLFCTCTHRKFKIYSPGALGGSLGAILGFFLALVPGGLLAHCVLALVLHPYFIFFFFTVLTSFYLSRYMCNRAKKKELGKVK
jgi:hypothetical protein